MFDEPAKEVEAFSVVKRGKSFQHAVRGIFVLLRTQHNMWIHSLAGLFAVALGIYFKINESEWLALLLSIGLVIIAESFNTAIEFDIDLTSPEEHPFARDTKDVAAGSVLLASVLAIVIGIIIFLPKIIILLS